MKNMKKFFVLGLSLIMVSTFAFGCGQKKDTDTKEDTKKEETTDDTTQTKEDNATGDKAKAGGKILFTMSSRDQFLTSMETAAAKYADENGVELVVMDSEDDITKQLSHIQTAVTDDYDAIICNLVNTDNSAEIISSAGDLPVVFVNRSPGEANLKADKYVYVGSDESDAGKFQAEYLAKYFKDQGKTEINAVLLQGVLGLENVIKRTDSVKKGLEDAGIKVNYVFEDTAKWDRATAQEMFIQFLGTGKQYDAVICNNDEMALGVIEAMEMQGVDPTKVPVVGIDATAVGCEAIQAGKMAFSVYQSAAGQGEGAVKAAQAIISGEGISKIEGTNDEKTIVWIPFEPVDKSNVEKYMK